MSTQMKIVTIIDKDDNEVHGTFPLNIACDIEGWDYETTDFGLDFSVGIPARFGGQDMTESRESRTDSKWNTVTMVWKIGTYA